MKTTRSGRLAIACWIVGSFFTTTSVTAEEAGLKKPYFDSDGVPIHYVVTGREDGEPVVLIHGFAGNIESHWTKVTDALKADYKVIAFDCRGHGGSGKPHDPKKYGVEMAHDVARLLDHLKIDKAHVAGYSMGAGIALRFAAHRPERVRTVTLGGSSGLHHSQEELIAAVADSLEKGNGLGPLLVALTPEGRPKPTPEAIKFIDDAVRATNDIKALAAVARAAIDDKPADEQIKAIRAPAMVLIGSDDPLRRGVEHLQKLLPGAKVVLIDHADHMTAIIRPEFAGNLRQFLEENRQRQGK